MSIKTIITDNSLASATIGDKTLTRRTEGDQVIYDGASGGGGSSVVGSGTVVNAPVVNGILSGGSNAVSRYAYLGTNTVGYTVPSGISKIIFLGAGGNGNNNNHDSIGMHTQYIGASIPQNTGSYVNYSTTPRQYLGDDQNFQVMWGYNLSYPHPGVFDDKLYIFAVPPAGGGIVWTSITLLLI